jgi:putative Holliday junction resolvase
LQTLIFAGEMGRIVAIDFGTKRCGIAATDELQLIASGLTTVDRKDLLEFLADYLNSEKVELLLIGEPKQKDGNPSEVEKHIQKFIKKFSEDFPDQKILRVDERYTSKMAFQSMIDSGLRKKQRQDKALLDEISATILLQEYLYNK